MYRHFVPLLRLFALIASAALLSHPLLLGAQVSPEATRPFSVYLYGMASATEHELNYGHALGETFGADLQHSNWIGADIRGVIIDERVPLHTYIGEAGPRITHRFGPVKPYAEGLFGIGHSGYTFSPNPLYTAYGALWTADFGADLRVTPRFQWRVADYSYSHIYVGNGAKPAILSTGVVFRLF